MVRVKGEVSTNHDPIQQPKDNSISITRTTAATTRTTTPSLLVRMTWITYLLGIHTTAVATLLYWPLVFDPNETMYFTTVAAHGGLLVLMIIDGMIVNRIPMYIMHWFVVILPLDLLFVIWSLIHDLLEVGNPDRLTNQDLSDNNDDALYPNVIAWKDDWSTSFFWSVVCILILGPLMFLLLWSISHGYIILGCGCCCGGGNPTPRLRYYYHDREDQYDNHKEDDNIKKKADSYDIVADHSDFFPNHSDAEMGLDTPPLMMKPTEKSSSSSSFSAQKSPPHHPLPQQPPDTTEPEEEEEEESTSYVL
jgi:hypothetical protein